MSYDPDHRRDTPLALKLKALVAERGPIPVKRYFGMCMLDSEHGYYRYRQAIGAGGDFITAPEISQVFGELVGLWAAVVWQQMGAPVRFSLVELGPGRGTMLADALRAAARVPGFLAAADVVLVEANEVLRQQQRAMLGGSHAAIRYLAPTEELPAVPTIVVANEHLDCLPVAQLERGVETDALQWFERSVGLDAHGALQFVRGRKAKLRRDADAHAFVQEASAGAILEDRNVRGIVRPLIAVGGAAPVAGLFIDYGHVESGLGDTLQAVRGHRLEHPLTSPGEADLTAQVDFAAFAATVREEVASGSADLLAIDGPVTQAEFLGRLGIVERASRLMAANPDKAAEIELGVARLMSPQGMGVRFKAIGVRSADMPPLPGLQR